MKFFAVTPFSMEAPVKNELLALGIPVDGVEEGRVYFHGDASLLARTCIFLRSADRVFRLLGEFEARTFDELFDRTTALHWADVIAPDGKIHVAAKCTRSQLMSPSDTQSIAKKAIVKALQNAYHKQHLPETGAEYPIEIQIRKDKVTVALDCCGVSLHKRGYRVKNAVAPLRETFASGLLLLNGYTGSSCFADPFCGSGTLVIEAALIAAHKAPGAERTFACESFKGIDKTVFENARRQARAGVIEPANGIYGGDVDPAMTEMTLFHARRAGVDRFLKVQTVRAENFACPAPRGLMVTNPPYGERIGDRAYMQTLCGEIGRMQERFAGWNCAFLSGFKQFERFTGKKADKQRRLYNGNIECNLYQYHGH